MDGKGETYVEKTQVTRSVTYSVGSSVSSRVDSLYTVYLVGCGSQNPIGNYCSSSNSDNGRETMYIYNGYRGRVSVPLRRSRRNFAILKEIVVKEQSNQLLRPRCERSRLVHETSMLAHRLYTAIRRRRYYAKGFKVADGRVPKLLNHISVFPTTVVFAARRRSYRSLWQSSGWLIMQLLTRAKIEVALFG